MTSALAELQRAFAARLVACDDDGDAGMAIYRRTIRANLRNALAATYPVVRALLGDAAFDTLAGAYGAARPSTCGDLNVYGEGLAECIAALEGHADARTLADVARLEWAIDEAARAADRDAAPAEVFAALQAIPVDALADCRCPLQPDMRLLCVGKTVLPTWRTRRLSSTPVPGDEGLLVGRDAEGVRIEPLAAAEHAWLAALADGATLGDALAGAVARDPSFDVASVVGGRIADGTLAQPRLA